MVIGRAMHGSYDREADPVQSVRHRTVHRRCLFVVAIMSQFLVSLAHELQKKMEHFISCSRMRNGVGRGSHHVLNFLKRNYGG